MDQNKCRELTSDILKDLFKDVDAILFDCDGVLYRGNNVITGTPEVLKRLQSLGKKLFFVTNNSTKTRKQSADKCTSMGFPATEESVITSGYVASCYLSDSKGKKGHKVGKIFCIGSESLMEELEMAGLSVVRNEVTPAGKGGIQMSTNYVPDPDVGCVVVGMDENLTYLKAAKAVRYLSSPDCLFVATNLDGSLPVSDGVFLPGSGSCVAMVERASGRSPDVVCGKPSGMMFDVARERFGVDAHRTLMVGDRLDTDIAFANECNLKSLLVLTGVSSTEEARKSEKNLQPDFILSSLADMLGLIESAV